MDAVVGTKYEPITNEEFQARWRAVTQQQPAILPDTIHLLAETIGHADHVNVLLACGHYTCVHERSSVWDFPEEGTWCDQCQTSVAFHDRVIAELERAWAEEAAQEEQQDKVEWVLATSDGEEIAVLTDEGWKDIQPATIPNPYTEVGVLYMTSDTGPNFLPVGVLNGRPVELCDAHYGEWRYTDERGGHVDKRDVFEQRLAR